MPITSHKPHIRLPTDERRRLMMLVNELKSRGIELPKSVISNTYIFPKDENGYFIKNDGAHFSPNENQERFIDSPARFVAFISGRGGGKSCSGAQKALKKIELGESGMVANPTFEDFKTSTWLEFKSWIPWDMVVPGQKYRAAPEWEPSQPFKLTFINGASVQCKGLNNPDSARGPNINWFWYDEAGKDITGEAWQIATASVRIGYEPQAWATTTPTGMNWLYEIFVEQDFPDDVMEAYNESGEMRELVEWYETSIIENKDNLDPGFYASILASYPTGYLREQEVYGKFVNPGGILGDPSWFNGKTLPVAPDTVRSRIRYWDLAASEKKIAKQKRTDPDETVGTKFSWDGEADFY
ncbi:MAG: terminase large subunit domain-containing protein, partial [Candidatus Hodarchaeales archaeon]